MPEELIPDNITEKQLNWGYWFVTHKILLKRILIVVLIALNAALVGFSGYGLVVDLLQGPERDAQLAELATPSQSQAWLAANAPKPLAISNTQVLAPQGKYDLVATVRNGNANYFAHFSYRFAAGDFATALSDGFILPGEEKLVVRLGEISAARPANAGLEISNIAWRRVDRHTIPDWSSFVAEHLDLPVTDVLYDPAVALPDGKTIGKTTFTVTNRTGYGYYDVKMIVAMYRGATVAGVNSAVFPTLRPGETRQGEVTWYEDLGAVSKITVTPEIDITDDSVYLRAR